MLNVEHGDNLSELLVAPSCLMEARRAKAAAERAEKEAEAAAGGDDNAVELFFGIFSYFFYLSPSLAFGAELFICFSVSRCFSLISSFRLFISLCLQFVQVTRRKRCSRHELQRRGWADRRVRRAVWQR